MLMLCLGAWSGCSSEAPSDSAKPSGKPAVVEPAFADLPTGEAAEKARLLDLYFLRMAELRDEYLQELEAHGWNTLLDPARLKSDRDLAQSRQILQRVRASVGKYKRKAGEALDALPQRVDELALSDTRKNDMRAGFQRGLTQSRPKVEQVWDLEMQTVEQFENLARFLSEHAAAWTVEDEQYVFRNAQDRSRFNAYLGTVRDLGIRQDAALEQGLASIDAALNALLR